MFNVCFVTITVIFVLVLILMVGTKLDTNSLAIPSVFISWLAAVVFPAISSRRAHGHCISQTPAC